MVLKQQLPVKYLSHLIMILARMEDGAAAAVRTTVLQFVWEN